MRAKLCIMRHLKSKLAMHQYAVVDTNQLLCILTLAETIIHLCAMTLNMDNSTAITYSVQTDSCG